MKWTKPKSFWLRSKFAASVFRVANAQGKALFDREVTARNRETALVVSAKSRVGVRVIKTNEELMIARPTARLIASQRN